MNSTAQCRKPVAAGGLAFNQLHLCLHQADGQPFKCQMHSEKTAMCWGGGFRVEGFTGLGLIGGVGFRVWGLGFRGLGFRALGFRVWGFRV